MRPTLVDTYPALRPLPAPAGAPLDARRRVIDETNGETTQPELRLVGATTRRDALASLHAEHYRSLVGTAYWILGDSTQAEEIAQDAFVRLAESWDRLKDPGAAPAYLRRTVINLSRSRVRRLMIGRRKRQQVASREQIDRIGAEPSSIGLADGDLGVAIRALPPRQRDCVVLRFVHDLTVADIAATLEIGEGSVKTHLHRALKTLGSALSEEKS